MRFKVKKGKFLKNSIKKSLFAIALVGMGFHISASQGDNDEAKQSQLTRSTTTLEGINLKEKALDLITQEKEARIAFVYVRILVPMFKNNKIKYEERTTTMEVLSTIKRREFIEEALKSCNLEPDRDSDVYATNKDGEPQGILSQADIVKITGSSTIQRISIIVDPDRVAIQSCCTIS